MSEWRDKRIAQLEAKAEDEYQIRCAVEDEVKALKTEIAQLEAELKTCKETSHVRGDAVAFVVREALEQKETP